jgi:hypothetical protein
MSLNAYRIGFYVMQYVCPYLSCTRRALEESMYVFQIHRIWYIRMNYSRSIFWIQKIFCSMTHWLSTQESTMQHCFEFLSNLP